MIRYGALLLLTALLLGRPGEVRAQDPAPLTKSEIVRLLGGSTYTDSEIEGIVRRSCLSFEPTERDWESFRELGAGEELLGAIRECVGATALRVALDPARIEATAGDTVSIRASLSRGDEPSPDVRLLLRESDGSGEEDGTGHVATTDATGTAVFRVAAGTGAGTRELRMSAPGASLQGQTTVSLVTTPAGPARVELEPDRLEPDRLEPGDGTGAEASRVTALVRDRFGNPVPDVVLEMHGDSTGSGTPLETATTDRRGRATLAVEGNAGEGDATFALVSGGRVLATLPVRAPPSVATEDANDGGDGGEPEGEPVARGEEAATTVATELARAGEALDRDRPEEAARRYESVVRRAPRETEAWLGLGRARVELGKQSDARRAFRRVLSIDPDHAGAREALRELAGFPARLELTMWGGDEFGGERGAGFRFARAELSPEPGLRIWAEYDDALHLNRPSLVRGRDAVKGWFGGAALTWGPEPMRVDLTTELEIGRRTLGELVQNYYRVEQRVNLSPEAGPGALALRAAVGGVLGRRYDRDDWQLYTRLEIPVRPNLALKPSLFVGRTMGTNTGATGSSSERERRVYLGLEYRPLMSVRIEPTLGVGRVRSDSAEAFSGVLMEAGLRLRVPLTPRSRGELSVRYQDPPGTPSFTVLGLGVTVGID